MPSAGPVRLLLLEFVSHERWVFDGRYYPFIQGWAETHGAPCLWLCFGTRFRVEKTGPSDLRHSVDLEDGDLAVLAAHVSALAPTHVVVSHPPSGRILERLAGGGVLPALLSVSDLPAPGCESFRDLGRRVFALERPVPGPVPSAGSNPSWQIGRTDWLAEWLGGGAIPRGEYLVGSVAPSYRAVMGNAEARAFRPHLVVMGGVSCDHFARVADNPAYAGLDLAGCDHDFGCAYCTWYRGPTSELGQDPLRAAGEQLRRIVETAGPDGRFRGVLDLHDVRLFRRLDRLADLVLELDLPPTTLCFEPRVDRVLEALPALERVVPRLARAGHSLYLFRMGAESLVEEENALYNKHLSLAQIDEVFPALERLARRHPGALQYDPTLGYITCSPWTTLEMLESGTTRAAERGFEPLGVWLYTPLILYRGSPITRLAERDGLVSESFDDPALLYEASANQVGTHTFVPWRFADPRTAVAFSLTVRFCAAALRGKYSDAVFRGDALYGRITASAPGPLAFGRPDLFAREVVTAVRAASPPYDAAALLESALRRYAALPAPAPAIASPVPGDPAREAHGRLRSLARSACARSPDLGGMAVDDARTGPDGRIRLRVEVDGVAYDLHLRDRRAPGASLFVAGRWNVSYDRATPLTAPAHVRKVRALVAALEREMAREAPDLLPGADPPAGPHSAR